MSGELWPDVEGGLRTWLRAQAEVNAVAGTRVFFGIPRDSPTFPLIELQRVGGGPEAGAEAPMDRALIQLGCWSREVLDGGGGSKAEAWSVASAVMTVLSSIRSRTQLAAGCFALDATVQALLWAPDPDTDQPRYVLTVEVAAVAS